MNLSQIVYSTFLPNIINFGLHFAKLLPKYKGCTFYDLQCMCVCTCLQCIWCNLWSVQCKYCWCYTC